MKRKRKENILNVDFKKKTKRKEKEKCEFMSQKTVKIIEGNHSIFL